jgi:ribosomal protein L7/L12
MNYYEVAIDIISKDQDWRELVFEIAKKNPSAIVSAYAKNKNLWQFEAKKLMDAGEKIKAIKYCRNETGFSLKEAKDAVEAL